jgi:diaminohydroxyphosphoribosylaminopyrimidine deaminase/5-amino-6-(5-phosphoribosylamino)uracil reductase
MVGAVLVRDGKLLGEGWHHRAGLPHAEVEVFADADRRGNNPAGATLYVTLEPCSTSGRTPPCTEAILAARISREVAAVVDPNPAHAGRAFTILRSAGITVTEGVLARESADLNETFHHWIVHKTPFVTVKAAMTLDGKIATATGESKWLTGETSRAWVMKLRSRVDAILVGIRTVLADDPALTIRRIRPADQRAATSESKVPPRRIVLDSLARTPLTARLVTDAWASRTTIIVSSRAPARRVATLKRCAQVIEAPVDSDGRLDLQWVLWLLGRENVTSLLVEGGGEVNARFLLGGFAQRVAFFYAPMILGGRDAIRAVAGNGVAALEDMVRLIDVRWRRLGADLLLTGRIASGAPPKVHQRSP